MSTATTPTTAGSFVARLERAPHAWGLLANVLFCVAIGLALSALDRWQGTVGNLVVSCCIGLSIHFWTLGAAWALSPRLPIQVITVLGMFLGVGSGVALGGALAFGSAGFFFEHTGGLWVGVLFGAIGVIVFGSVAALWDVRARLTAAERAHLERSAQLAEAELRALQAQIEPHFLFNTLSNVLSLIPEQPERASRMLERLTLLLRTSLERSRATEATVADEIRIVRAYLEIQQMRMPDRLACTIEVAPDAEECPLPPLLLQPLVENAVTHGAEPRPGRTTIAVRVRRDGSALHLTVRDDGEGIDAGGGGRGHGSALANIRGRLRSLYGDPARLALREVPNGGIEAELRVPAAGPTRIAEPPAGTRSPSRAAAIVE